MTPVSSAHDRAFADHSRPPSQISVPEVDLFDLFDLHSPLHGCVVVGVCACSVQAPKSAKLTNQALSGRF